MAGVFITLEGIDGCGKSTQLPLLAEWLSVRGVHPVITREPGGTPLGRRIRAAVLDVNEQVDPLAELLLYAADRAQHVRTVIEPALTTGRVVVSDRYADATAAYQGAGREFPPALIAQVIRLATDGLKPDLTLLFDLPVALALSRVHARKQVQPDRLDIEHDSFHQRVRQAYLAMAAAEPNRFRILDASGSIEEIQSRVTATVTDFLDGRAGFC